MHRAAQSNVVHFCWRIGSAEALLVLCVRCTRWEREREREREIQREREIHRERERERERVRRKWRHPSSAENGEEFCTFRCQNAEIGDAYEVCIFPCQKIWTLVSALLKGAEFTLSVAKNVALFETVRALRFASVKWRDRGSKHRNKRSNFRLHRPSSHRKKKRIKLIPKTIGNRKRDCAWCYARRIDKQLRKSADRKAQISPVSGTNALLICAFRLQIFWCGVYPPSTTSRTISFFYFQ